jgi:serine/threonine protein kinase
MPLLRIAYQIADEEACDWPVGLDEDDEHVVEQLRVVARIVALQRASAGQLRSSATASSTPGVVSVIGEKLGTWQHLVLHECVGSGSYGRVFRATDSRLDREVALKLVGVAHTGSAQMESSVLDEGQLLAKVRHPNVMAVFGAEAVGGEVGVWGEFLHGQTLSEMVAESGPLSAREAALVGISVCGALAAVHRAGLLHRDVKAQNVMREKGGRIVLLDFGTGRALRRAPGDSPRDLKGTPLYMAPELFEGAAASLRSDVYSVGVLLHFLVTGSFPVDGESSSDVRRAHRVHQRRLLRDERPDLPDSFVATVGRALASDPHQRYGTMGEMEVELGRSLGLLGRDAPMGTSVTPSHSVPSVPFNPQEYVNRLLDSGELTLSGGRVASGPRRTFPPVWRRRLSYAVLVAVALTLGLIWRPGNPSVGEKSHIAFHLEPPAAISFTEGSRNVAATSPDGRGVVFLGTDPEGNTSLWFRSLDDLTAKPFPGTSDASNPFFSPDGRSIGFFTRMRLMVIHDLHGPAERLATVSMEPRGGTWNQTGTLLFSPDPHAGISSVSVGGGEVEAVTTPDFARGEIGHLWPYFLPDGERFLYFVSSNSVAVRGIYLASTESGENQRLVESNSSGIFANNHILFLREGSLVAQRFDVETLTSMGPAKTLTSPVAVTNSFRGAFSASTTGVLTYSSGAAKDVTRLTRLGVGEEPDIFLTEATHQKNPTSSADGSRVAIEIYESAQNDIRILDVASGASRRVNDPTSQSISPVLSADGKRLLFSSNGKGPWDIYYWDIDGTTPPRLLVESSSDKEPTDLSWDGSRVALFERTERGDYDILLAETARRDVVVRLLQSPHNEISGRFSPDGNALAYVSDESGRFEVYRQRLPPDGRKCQVSKTGGYDPHWSARGTLYFLDMNGTMWAAPDAGLSECESIAAAPRFVTGIRTPGTSRNHYAVYGPDDRILVNAPAPSNGGGIISVIVGWPSLLEGKPLVN